jgi:hypothetical protein
VAATVLVATAVMVSVRPLQLDIAGVAYLDARFLTMMTDSVVSVSRGLLIGEFDSTHGRCGI